jgi:hypothetical protein
VIILKALGMFLSLSFFMSLVLAVPYGIYWGLGETPEAFGVAMGIGGVFLFNVLFLES